MKKLVISMLTLSMLAIPAMARENISIVGSSTVFPFSAAVAEQFHNNTKFPAPIVESTGTGGGVKLFCAGAGIDTPDIVNASRKMKDAEVKACKDAGVNNPIELQIGRDAIVIAHVKDKPKVSLSLEQIYLALAKDVPVDGKLVPNPYKKWSDIDSKLPNVAIVVFGPPTTSGTRDSFVNLAMTPGCKEALKNANIKLEGDAEKAACETMRQDGGFVESGENDSLLIQKLVNNPDTFAIFGFSFLDNSRDKVAATIVNGVEPTVETATNGSYFLSRDLYVYVKREHIGSIPGIKEFATEMVSEKAIGDEGYLAEKGLIIEDEAIREQQRQKLK
jgi:phosphate transport system substrate-binding protein